MTTSDCVVVFVDALPYEERDRLQAMQKTFRSWAPIRPGFGYSINVKSELFAGLRPDEAGFLNEWSYEPGKGYQWAKYASALNGIFSKSRILRRGVNKIISRVVGESLRNIPFTLLDSVFRTGVTAYEHHYPRPTVFSEFGVEKFLYSEHGNDAKAFTALCARLSDDDKPTSAFLAMAGLDHIMHRDGKESVAYAEEIQCTDKRLATIWELLEARNNQPRLSVLSDHGMARVDTEVSFEIESNVAGVGDRYGYFVDATMARVWTNGSAVMKQVVSWIENTELPGRILSSTERKTWGISAADFGDIIFLLNEGAIFVPNFFSDFGCAAMHGYQPDLISQQGLLASTLSLEATTPTAPIPAHEAFRHLMQIYSGANSG